MRSFIRMSETSGVIYICAFLFLGCASPSTLHLTSPPLPHVSTVTSAVSKWQENINLSHLGEPCKVISLIMDEITNIMFHFHEREASKSFPFPMIQFWFNLQEIQKRSLKLYRVKLYIFFKEDSFWGSDNNVVETDKKNKECITKNLSFLLHAETYAYLYLESVAMTFIMSAHHQFTWLH